MAINVSGRVTVQSFGLSCNDAEDKDDWRLRITVANGVCAIVLGAVKNVEVCD